jgi:hypothetical protein
MKEIPTFVADTLPEEHPHHGYIVLNRPYAFLQVRRSCRILHSPLLRCPPLIVSLSTLGYTY